MIAAPLPENEKERLHALKNLEVLDTPSEQDFEDIVKLASAICQTPISLVSLVDSQRQWFKARVGLIQPQLPRDIAFCAHAILDDELMVVPDAAEDERFFDNPLVVNNPHIRFYAGMPLITRAGYKIGTLCVIDSVPRQLSAEQKFALQTLGKQVMNMMELRFKNQRLSKLNSLQNKFLAIISHDVRNPLVTTKSLMELVESEEITADEFKQLSSKLGNSVSNTLDLLNNLIDWGLSQTRGDAVDIKPIKINTLVDAELKRLAQAAEGKRLALISTIDGERTVMCDANMFNFIIRNLITNAIKFTATGAITVGLDETPHGWILTVSDTGVGIPEDRQKKLFNWENRHTTIGTSNEAGSGFGLLMCKEFAEKHQGTISFVSTPGKGTTFMVELNTKFLTA